MITELLSYNTISSPPVLFSDGNEVTPNVFPKGESNATSLGLHRIRYDPGVSINEVRSWGDPESENFQAFRSIVLLLLLKISANSTFGNPTAGSGSDINSVITTS